MDMFEVGDNVVDKFSKDIGVIQGKREKNGVIEWKVRFSAVNVKFIREDFLEKIEEDDLIELFQKGKYLGIKELKRILAFARIKGDVTNIYYSMNNRATQFFAHQFKPVMKFIESTTGRLLIADEVGLGKTIEAMYIWEELIARENSKRLLIVCPAVLCDKWKNDLYNYFSIEAEIAKAEALLENIEQAVSQPIKKHFALITSLEGIRYKEKKNNHIDVTPKARLYNYLEQLSEDGREDIFDLVVIDEAHYLRNSETASFKTASIIRDNARNLILLSATPIQTGEDNLFNLLRILSPEEFYDQYAFYQLLKESQKFIMIANLLRSDAPEEKYREIIKEIYEGSFYKEDKLLGEFEGRLLEIISNRELRLNYYNKFMKKVFYSAYITRTRKRDAFENRSTRDPNTIRYNLNDYEKYLYENVTKVLQDASKSASTFCQFQIIARQRQMASCMPAAFMDWKEKKQNDDAATNLDEQLMDDLGFYSDEEDEEQNSENFDINNAISDININIKDLIAQDSKYLAIKNVIAEKIKDNPKAKIIVFSYYRGTIKYLSQRFADDNISCISMMGGQKINKQEVVQNFKENEKINILLSTEVGSEGIDMQFCDTEFNYDLPWNPMRLEQRIGRIDRIGQESPVLHIINLICKDTVEDRVLDRLYDRIEIFKNSIGDIEEILGNELNSLAIDLLKRELSETEKEKKADERIDTIVMKKNQLEELETQASTVIAYKDYLIQNVEEAKETKRFVNSNDLLFYVKDYLESTWPGSVVKNYSALKHAAIITLSPDAGQCFSQYLEKQGINSTLKYSTNETLCLFDASEKEKVKKGKYEVISYSSPIIKWITDEKMKYPSAKYGCSSLILKDENNSVPKGMYTYYLQEWNGEGYKNKKEIKYYLCNLDTLEVINPLTSEEMIMKTINFGDSNPAWDEKNEVHIKACEALNKLFEVVDNDYSNFENNFILENEELCKQQKSYLSLVTDRKIDNMNKLLEDYRNSDSNKQKLIKSTETRIKNTKEKYEMQIRSIENKIKARCTSNDIGMGILKII